MRRKGWHRYENEEKIDIHKMRAVRQISQRSRVVFHPHLANLKISPFPSLGLQPSSHPVNAPSVPFRCGPMRLRNLWTSTTHSREFMPTSLNSTFLASSTPFPLLYKKHNVCTQLQTAVGGWQAGPTSRVKNKSFGTAPWKQ
jgi:hypothetical protein